ncbi:bifunctional serine/threonine-protein kinase/ABC transporter substrate-binding protein [Crocosphaera sp. UHCC 0190]|uniref:bifunctional serine/threonine-protein kinase/ABC transporter substrate-binding protein n=1 Tax=Crocosphaera sp. UHCC 0190 TaxID=3110246 RepID=UPI002B21C7E5|nr:bifunctional serine/threonine-protein kinase/ABC transporter substrate-binding protein [Crocosphaera sp. UHCC 0190]MEA5511199.1 bifunctional serine/threonine-protein kinase/ABC transporter substrate-binding protein [Crocosphaera sp. UHCC 0190]
MSMSPRHHPHDIIGEHYEIISLLGEGGFGETYLAINQRRLNEYCVVKYLKPYNHNSLDLEAVEGILQREAKALYRLNHDQIPRFIEFFRENNDFYLVQEYIEGTPLNQEIKEGCKHSEEYVLNFLKDILNILVYIHENNIIHRDIKPSNIIRRKKDNKLCLIDFGLGKITEDISSLYVVEPPETHGGGTRGYTPPEQLTGNPMFCSDLYAVGMTAIKALTGIHPYNFNRDQNHEIIWRSPEIKVSHNLAKIIDKLVRFYFGNRYQLGKDVLRDIESIKIGSVWGNKVYLTLFFCILFTILVMGNLKFLSIIFTQSCAKKLEDYDQISCGEKALIRITNLDKQKGVRFFKIGDYKSAIDSWNKALKKVPNDPETLIYINNAKLLLENRKFSTIAVAIPLGKSSEGGDAGQEILKGVAQFQNKINQKKKEFGLQIIIANDDNNPKQAEENAKILGQNHSIVAVIGHYSSDITITTLPIYQAQNLVLISPTSSADELSSQGDFFLRTIAQDSDNIKNLSQYLIKQKKGEKAAVLYNPYSQYSLSLYNAFLKQDANTELNIVQTFNLSDSLFNERQTIAEIATKGVNTLVLFPDAKVDNDAFKNAINIIVANHNNFLIIGGDALYSRDILAKQELSEGIIISISWHYLNSADHNFVCESKQLWGGYASYRTANSYDAAKTIMTAIEQTSVNSFSQKMEQLFNSNFQRKKIHDQLKRDDFKLQGVTGTIEFEPNGNRKNPPTILVKVVADTSSEYGYKFVPVHNKNTVPNC